MFIVISMLMSSSISMASFRWWALGVTGAGCCVRMNCESSRIPYQQPAQKFPCVARHRTHYSLPSFGWWLVVGGLIFVSIDTQYVRTYRVFRVGCPPLPCTFLLRIIRLSMPNRGPKKEPCNTCSVCFVFLFTLWLEVLLTNEHTHIHTTGTSYYVRSTYVRTYMHGWLDASYTFIFVYSYRYFTNIILLTKLK